MRVNFPAQRLQRRQLKSPRDDGRPGRMDRIGGPAMATTEHMTARNEDCAGRDRVTVATDQSPLGLAAFSADPVRRLAT